MLALSGNNVNADGGVEGILEKLSAGMTMLYKLTISWIGGVFHYTCLIV